MPDKFSIMHKFFDAWQMKFLEYDKQNCRILNQTRYRVVYQFQKTNINAQINTILHSQQDLNDADDVLRTIFPV